MANPGSLEWAEQTLTEVENTYQYFESKADSRQAEPATVGGRENLKEMLRRLDEVIEFVSIYQANNHLASRLYHQSLRLHHLISAWLYK